MVRVLFGEQRQQGPSSSPLSSGVQFEVKRVELQGSATLFCCWLVKNLLQSHRNSATRTRLLIASLPSSTHSVSELPGPGLGEVGVCSWRGPPVGLDWLAFQLALLFGFVSRGWEWGLVVFCLLIPCVQSRCRPLSLHMLCVQGWGCPFGSGCPGCLERLPVGTGGGAVLLGMVGLEGGGHLALWWQVFLRPSFAFADAQSQALV